ncbi:MAG TPA: hypothetical protein VNP20_02520, partial [Nocardioidaceae bacterium]|nr:hypothetical protein [Nocardioidaceae bacterium]
GMVATVVDVAPELRPALLEAGLGSSDERTRELISVSFVESVGPWDADVEPFVATWPERLAREARFYV